MKQSTIVDRSTFQTITTLETECCQCHSITHYVAHATILPRLDNGVKFSGDVKCKDFIDFDKVINQQSEIMSDMQNKFDAAKASLIQEINFLKSVIKNIL